MSSFQSTVLWVSLYSVKRYICFRTSHKEEREQYLQIVIFQDTHSKFLNKNHIIQCRRIYQDNEDDFNLDFYQALKQPAYTCHPLI